MRAGPGDAVRGPTDYGGATHVGLRVLRPHHPLPPGRGEQYDGGSPSAGPRAPPCGGAARSRGRNAAAHRRAPSCQLVQMNRARFAFIEFEDPQAARSCPRNAAAPIAHSAPARACRPSPVLLRSRVPPHSRARRPLRDGSGTERYHSGGQAGQVRPVQPRSRQSGLLPRSVTLFAQAFGGQVACRQRHSPGQGIRPAATRPAGAGDRSGEGPGHVRLDAAPQPGSAGLVR